MSDPSDLVQRLLAAADEECNIFAGGEHYASEHGLAPFQSHGDWLAWMLHDAYLYEMMVHQVGETLFDRITYRETLNLLRKHADALLACGVQPTLIAWPSIDVPEVSPDALRLAHSRLADLCTRVQVERQQGELALIYLGRVIQLKSSDTLPTVMEVLPGLLEQAEISNELLRGQLAYLLGEDYEIFNEALAETI